MPSPYLKPALSYDDQLILLKSRGMVVDDDQEALFYLQHLNYYRLRAYWQPFEVDSQTHNFKPGTSFSKILDLYRFDREFRLLLLDAIERLEVCIRANWAYVLGRSHGPQCYRDPSIVSNPKRHQNFLKRLERDLQNSHETFIVHFRSTYGVTEVPVWAVCEVLSLGMLSRVYQNSSDRHAKRRIARASGACNEVLLESWLHHFSYLRNLCAHHCRLWNRHMIVAPMVPRTNPEQLAQTMTGGKRVYDSLLIMLNMLDTISPRHSWRSRTIDLLESAPRDGSESWRQNQMGFPSNWRALPIWDVDE